jgi:hypothetical protein
MFPVEDFGAKKNSGDPEKRYSEAMFIFLDSYT